MLVGDFNVKDSETYLPKFLFGTNAKNIVNNYTCYKNFENPSCIILVITNSALNFQNMVAIRTDLPDFRKMVITVLKTVFSKLISKKLIYIG